MDSTNELVEKFHNLSLQQQQLVLNLVDEIANSSNNNTSVIETSKYKTRDTNSKFKSANRTSIRVGDEVEILNNRNLGEQGIPAR